jgi:3-deoxy-7-phosphoheptulonate synthase
MTYTLAPIEQQAVAARATAEPLPTPLELASAHHLEPGAADIIHNTRREIIDIMEGRDPRMLVVVGPCSLDDSRQPDGAYSAVRFAEQLQELSQLPGIRDNLLIIMRCPPPKPRTALGQRGLEQRDIATSHEILTAIANKGIPLASEVMLARHMAQYGDLLSLVWTGARNGEDVNLRHTLSAYPEIPVYSKNAGSGDPAMATDAAKTIAAPHQNVEIMLPDGRMGAVAQSPGNPHVGVLYRGGKDALDAESYEKQLLAVAALSEALGLPFAADTSHGGSVAHVGEKSAEGQRQALKHLMGLAAGRLITLKALWIEGYLEEGADASGNTPGMSLTDACVGINGVRTMLEQVAAVHATLQTEKVIV